MSTANVKCREEIYLQELDYELEHESNECFVLVSVKNDVCTV
jgi:hypothetical protein